MKPEHIEKTKRIILDIINRKLIVDSIELTKNAEEVLNIVYSIGGAFDDKTIKSVAEVKIKEWYHL